MAQNVFLGIPGLAKIGENFELSKDRSVCTRFATIFNPISEFHNHFSKFSFLGHFGAILGVKIGPKLNFSEVGMFVLIFFGFQPYFQIYQTIFRFLNFGGVFGAILGGQNWPEIDLVASWRGTLHARLVSFYYF